MNFLISEADGSAWEIVMQDERLALVLFGDIPPVTTGARTKDDMIIIDHQGQLWVKDFIYNFDLGFGPNCKIERLTHVAREALGDPLPPMSAVILNNKQALALSEKGLLYGTGRVDSKIATEGFTRTTFEGVVPKITALACGENHYLALDETGQVWAKGTREAGQGIVTDANRHHVFGCLNLPVVITSVAAGTEHSLLLDECAQIWGCGSSRSSQLGSRKSYYQSFEKLSWQPPCGETRAIAAACNISFVLDTNEQVWIAGQPPHYGMTGKKKIFTNFAQPKDELPPVVAITAYHYLVCLTDEDDYIWVSGLVGEIGDCTYTAGFMRVEGSQGYRPGLAKSSPRARIKSAKSSEYD